MWSNGNSFNGSPVLVTSDGWATEPWILRCGSVHAQMRQD